MSGRSFLDTNIFVYTLDRTNPEKAGIALDLIKTHVAQRSGVVSFQVVQEFFNVAYKRFPSAMPMENGAEYLATVFRPLLSVHSSLALYSEALSVCRRYRLAWYDSVIVAAAMESGCVTLFTEDMQHGAKFGSVQIENPFR
jgi:predicted nucleic acid-binding protein